MKQGIISCVFARLQKINAEAQRSRRNAERPATVCPPENFFRLSRYLLPILLLIGPADLWPQSVHVLKSPNGALAMTFETVVDGRATQASGRLVYSVTFHGKPLVDRSALSLELQGQRPLGTNISIVQGTNSRTDETYRLVWGKANSVRDHFNALRLELVEQGGPKRNLVVEARAYNDAVAFRYVIPGHPSKAGFQLTKEHTEFRISKDATTYALILPNYRSMYESEFVKLPISGFANQGGVASTVLIGLPLLMEVPGVGWMAITEAHVQDYPAMYLVNPSGSWEGHWFESRLAPRFDDPELAAVGTLPLYSPWRVLLVGTEPGRLIESNAILSLNPESALKDVSWIQPGKSSWDWWSGSIGSDGKGAFTTATMKHFVDFSSRSGLEFMLVDAGWYVEDDITKMNGTVDVPEVIRYAAGKNVRVWIWLHWEPVARQMDEAFALYEKWGVAGVKIDFMSRDDQEMMGFYYTVAEKAAGHRLMVDFHGSTKPTGVERTFPNVVGYEAVLGMEQSKAGARDNPDNRLMIPFTRMLAGPVDYTPGGFRNVTREEFRPSMDHPVVMGTRAHHLAMYVVYQVPFQMVSDHPGAYENEPSFKFIRDVPATWDETRVLNGMPGEFISIARRQGADWFLGSMTNWTARRLELKLDFLGSGSYTAEIYADAPDSGKNPRKVLIEKKKVDRTSALIANLASAGGYAVRLTPAGK